MQFVKAERQQAMLRLGITGVAGSGKTYGALRIATGITDKLGGRIAVIDTEHKSSALYAHDFDFDVLDLADHSTEAYIAAVAAAVKAGYRVVIIDSLTHAWTQIKAEVDHITSTTRTTSMLAWARVTPKYEALMRCILQSDIHIIATVRTKADYVTYTEGGKTKMQKVGTKPDMRDGFDYELTSCIEIDHSSNSAICSKDRTRIFQGKTLAIDESIGHALVDWLQQGQPVAEPYDVAEVLAAVRQIENIDQIKNVGIEIKKLIDDPAIEIKSKDINELRQALKAKKSEVEANDEYARISDMIDEAKTLQDIESIKAEIGNSKTIGELKGEIETKLNLASEEIGAAG